MDSETVPRYAVNVKILDYVVPITGGLDGELTAGGELGALITHFIHNDLMKGRVRTLSELLRAAIRVAQEFDGEVTDLEALRGTIRDDWIRLLKANLIGDPAQSQGNRMNTFYPWRETFVSIMAFQRRKVYVGGLGNSGAFDLGNAKYLKIQMSADGRSWQTTWDSITSITFTFLEAPDKELARLLSSQG